MNPPKLPSSVVRGRRVVIGLLVVSAVAGACAVVALLVLLVPLLWAAAG
ncbi:MAG TPA: hypothetical protein VGE11_27880 [Pseudonocardia sp.]